MNVEGLEIPGVRAEWREAYKSEWIVSFSGSIKQMTTHSSGEMYIEPMRLVLIPDNIYNVADLAGMKLPEGEERISGDPKEWFRPYVEGERVLDATLAVIVVNHTCSNNLKYIILRPRPAKKRYLVIPEQKLEIRTNDSVWPTNGAYSVNCKDYMQQFPGSRIVEE